MWCFIIVFVFSLSELNVILRIRCPVVIYLNFIEQQTVFKLKMFSYELKLERGLGGQASSFVLQALSKIMFKYLTAML